MKLYGGFMKGGINMSKFCRKCGKELADDASFCDGCGKKVGMQPKTVSREEAIAQGGKVKGHGCFLVIIVLLLIGLFGCVAMMSSGGSEKTQVDNSFIENINATLGVECSYNISDHLIWYDEDLEEYIGKGSFQTLDKEEYQYNFRAFIQGDTIVFAKVDVYDLLGNHVIDIYEQERELEHYSNLSEKD